MEKRSDVERHSKRVKVRSEPSTVQLVLLRNVKMKTRGPVTGKYYLFNGAGSVVAVDKDDAPHLLAKHGGKSCCGGVSYSPYFAIAE